MKPITALGKLFFNIVLTFALAFAVASAASLFVDVDAVAAAAVFSFVSVFAQTVALSFRAIDKHVGSGNVAYMAIQREIWQNDIVEALFKDNQFLNYAVNADQYVLQGKVVHIPNASGTRPGTKVNRTLLPATVTQRVGQDIFYSLDEITTDPIHIPHADTVELSYAKRQSVMTDLYETIRDVAADLMLNKWAPASSADTGTIIRTTGTSRLTYLPGATGNRKRMKIADLLAAKTAMDKQNVSKQNRYALFSTEMIGEMLEEMSATAQRDFTMGQDIANGIVGKLYGFNIMERAETVLYAHGSPTTKKAFGAAAAATDCDSVICWQMNSVERALGEVKFFENLDDPTYYGDIYSTLIRLGGRIRRADLKGVIAIVQDNA